MVVGELRVIEAEQVEDCRVPVVDVQTVLDGPVADLIRRSVAQTALHTAASHPDRVAFVVVIATVAALRIRRAAKLARPHHKRVFQHATRLQITQKRRDGLIRRAAAGRELFTQTIVMIPLHGRRDLDETHACLRQSPR